MKKPFISKQSFKHRKKECQICGEKRYNLLDVHRWKTPGKDGGKYTVNNCICVCSNCHRLIHNNKIKIIGIFNSSNGKLLNYIDENNTEQFNQIGYI
jgi:hypothetical protein